MKDRARFIFSLLLPAICCFLLGTGALIAGPVDIPATDVFSILAGRGGSDNISWQFIVLESRLPMVLTAFAAGASLSTAGMLLQTTFENPLSGPSILGVSTGASLGVAVLTLGASTIFPALSGSETGSYIALFGGALAGAMAIILLLAAFSRMVRNGVMLLITGIMVSYLTSAAITILNFFAPPESVKTFAVWGMGSFSATDLQQSYISCILTVLFSVVAYMQSKKLNVLLLGTRYAGNLGYSVPSIRTQLLVISGILTAVTTAYCGPIGFIGLIVPHIARMLTGTSDHFRLIPVCFLTGGAVALLCALTSVLPDAGMLPVNAITPVISIPVIVYIILNRRNLNYFN